MIAILFKWKVTFSNSQGLFLVLRNTKIADTIQRAWTRSSKIRGYNSFFGKTFGMIEFQNTLSLNYTHLQSTKTYLSCWQRTKNLSKTYSSCHCQKKLLHSSVNLTSLFKHYLKMMNLISGLIYGEMVTSLQKMLQYAHWISISSSVNQMDLEIALPGQA
jgi:hypothetical protein